MQRWSLSQAVLIGGAIGGLLDLMFAISFAYANGATPLRLLQTIATGVLGEQAYLGELGAGILGLALHFFIAMLFAAAYVIASQRVRVLVAHPIVVGAVFGALVFFTMRLIVLPLSAFPYPVSFKPLATALDLLSHMFLFGVPIAWAARKTRAAADPQALSSTA